MFIGEIHLPAWLEDLVRYGDMLKGSFIESNNSSSDFFDVVCFNFIGPDEPFFAFDGTNEFLITF